MFMWHVHTWVIPSLYIMKKHLFTLCIGQCHKFEKMADRMSYGALHAVHKTLLLCRVGNQTLSLPSANEVWGQVLFLHLFVCSKGDLCPGDLWWGLCPGDLQRVSSVQGCLCPGVLCRGDPPYSEEWAVHILLECFLFLLIR